MEIDAFHINGPLSYLWGEPQVAGGFSLTKKQWYKAVLFSLLLVRTNFWTNSWIARDYYSVSLIYRG